MIRNERMGRSVDVRIHGEATKKLSKHICIFSVNVMSRHYSPILLARNKTTAAVPVDLKVHWM